MISEKDIRVLKQKLDTNWINENFQIWMLSIFTWPCNLLNEGYILF